jgi:hypothetical protein
MTTLTKTSKNTTRKVLNFIDNSEYILTFEGTLDDYYKINRRREGGILLP